LTKRKEKILLFFSDLISVNIVWGIYYYIRILSGLIENKNPPSFLMPMVVVYLYWFLLFGFAGLYQHWFARSRFDEFSSVIKISTLGCLILFFAIFIDDINQNAVIVSRFLILIYWILLIVFVSLGRIIIRSLQLKMLEKGIGLRNTVIIGTGVKAFDLLDTVKRYPQLGYKFTGFVKLDFEELNENVIGDISEIHEIVENKSISEILVALEPQNKDILIEIINKCSDLNVHLKIMPDMYEIVSGMARTNQLYGIPLIEVMPELMPQGTRIIKRFIDIVSSFLILTVVSPLFIIISILIKVTSKGSVFYLQERVGRNGKKFKIYKFRSMVENAESEVPVWAGKDDKRVTSIGKFLRRTRIDEIPQFINVLKNDMSIVGPRPERPYFIEKLKKEIPYYTKRLVVKPGITGWAQIKHTYDFSVDDVKTKLQYDFYYIENMSLTLDFKIMINTIFVVFSMKGH
jgi:exopolysaccharide biosynthesis polyprenyl glycosylphosphotransferase